MSFVIRVFFVTAGAVGLGFAFYKLIGPVSYWYESNLAKSDDDLGRAYMVALTVQVVALFAGGWLGELVFRRWRRRWCEA